MSSPATDKARAQYSETNQGRNDQAQRIKPWPHPSPDDWETKSEIACRACVAIDWLSSIYRAAPADSETAALEDDVLELLWWLTAHLIAGQTMYRVPCLCCR